MSVFFTADTHFGDHRILNIGKRPFPSLPAMNEVLVSRWNETVGPEDEVWHLGDFARTGEIGAAFLARLNGRKHLVTGNNDPAGTAALPWASVTAYTELTLDGLALVLCHYPFRSWNGMGRGAINLHGHSHGRLKPMPRQFDVGVDARDFRPVRLSALLER